MKILFKNWPVLAKLLIAFFSILIALTLTNFLLSKRFDSLDRNIKVDLGTYAVPGLGAMTRVSYGIPLMRAQIYRYCFFTDPERRQTIYKELKDVHEQILAAMSDYKITIINENDKKDYTDLKEKIDKYWWWVEETIKVIQDGKTNKEVQEFMAQYTPLYKEVDKLIKYMIEENSRVAKSAVRNTDIVVTESRKLLQGALVICSILSILFLIILTFSIALPLKKISNKLIGLSQGRVNKDQEKISRTDEIGHVQKATQETSAYLSQMAEVSKSIAQGDLTVSVSPKSKDDVMGTAFQEMIANLKNSVKSILNNAELLSSTSKRMSVISADLNHNSGEASKQALNVSESIQKVNQGIQSVASASEQMALVAKEISNKTIQISEKINSTSDTASSMLLAAQSANQIIETVANIAQQTNMLAINATLEASRAGEAGRGFSVVASAVKNLAIQSFEATKNISSLLSEISLHAENVKKGTDEAKLSTGVVSNAVAEQSIVTQDMGTKLGRAASDSTGIVNSVEISSASVAQTQQGGEQVSSAAEDLARVAQDLEKTVKKFKIG